MEAIRTQHKPPALEAKPSEELQRLKEQLQHLHERGRYEEGLDLARRAMILAEEELGPDHAGVAFTLGTLAWLCWEKRSEADAGLLSRRALSILDKAHPPRKTVSGPEPPRPASTLGTLARLYQATGEDARAKRLYRGALAVCEKVLGAENPDVATLRHKLAELDRGEGDDARTESLDPRLLSIREPARGLDQPARSKPSQSFAALVSGAAGEEPVELQLAKVAPGMRGCACSQAGYEGDSRAANTVGFAALVMLGAAACSRARVGRRPGPAVRRHRRLRQLADSGRVDQHLAGVHGQVQRRMGIRAATSLIPTIPVAAPAWAQRRARKLRQT